MIKNTIYSYDYSQPEDYRFSLDSVFLAQKVAHLLKSHPRAKELRILDLCAGCGVVGLELNFNCDLLTKIDFLEVQEVYRPHFEHNVKQAQKPGSDFRFLLMNYADLKTPEYEKLYGVVVSNPPYFFPGEGLLSPNEFKNRCRFFIDSDFGHLMSSTHHVLKDHGSAFFLIRPGSHHGRDLMEDIKKLNLFSTVQIVDEVRGTHVVELVKAP